MLGFDVSKNVQTRIART